VVFLAEAFTRPKVMKALAKLGFTQSYTYFTWRTGKDELQAYLSEITGYPEQEYFRPNFFVNTPDILPFHLQRGEQWMFKARVALAATLSGNYGIYNGFELIEHEPIPGKEEYSTSEIRTESARLGQARQHQDLYRPPQLDPTNQPGAVADRQPALHSGR
jgi:starch synthase (maltosyl-transferring)